MYYATRIPILLAYGVHIRSCKTFTINSSAEIYRCACFDPKTKLSYGHSLFKGSSELIFFMPSGRLYGMPGNAEMVAKNFQFEFKRRGVEVLKTFVGRCGLSSPEPCAGLLATLSQINMKAHGEPYIEDNRSLIRSPYPLPRSCEFLRTSRSRFEPESLKVLAQTIIELFA